MRQAGGPGEITSTGANRQPAVAHYVRRPATPPTGRSSSKCSAWTGGRIAEIVSFGPGVFPAFDLPTSQ